MRRIERTLCGVIAAALVGTGARQTVGQSLPPAANRPVDFVADIQPIFKAACVKCHGPDKQSGGLRLDHRTAALAGAPSGKVILPGRSAESRLIQLVSGLDEDLVMPREGDRLTPVQIGLLRAWMDQGAPWPAEADDPNAGKSDHWAYQPPVRWALPAVKRSDWPRNAIDDFVLARMEAHQLDPSPEADRTTLIRRASLDLTGLPPTVEEVDAYLADDDPHAYERVVDRLLDSPHYGERWARLWLDLARYADTNGYEKDARRSIWRYRDWVIEAFNRDLTFDRFTIEQLAGDLLENPTLAQRIATGFHRNTMTNTEGGTNDEEFRIEAVVDRVDTTMQVWMGTTFGCGRCHEHKYDPFTQREYYQVLAFLNNTADHDANNNEPVIEAPTDEHIAQRTRIESQIAPLQRTLDTPTPELAAAQARWEARRAAIEASWHVLDATGVISANGASLARHGDGSILVGGNRPQRDTYTVVVNTDLTGITAFRLEALTDGSLPKDGPGRADDGSFAVSEFKVTASQPDGEGEATIVELEHASSDTTQKRDPVGKAIDGDAKTSWVVRRRPGEPRTAVFETKKPIGLADGTTLTFEITQQQSKQQTLGRFRLSATKEARPVQVWDIPANVKRGLAVVADERSDDQKTALAAFYRSIAPELQSTRNRIAALKKQIPEPITTLVLSELDTPRETHILLRGNFLSKGDAVSPRVPAVWHAFPADAPMNRLGLARWLVSPNNPLVGRVTLNRFWEQYFGAGLVRTSEDFGTQGEPPTHPKLLDWLATEFVRQGWSMKAMHRLIVTSATYRQSSRVTPDGLERDPSNRWLARGPRFRLEAEMIRDRILATSGLLSRKLYGPSVMPHQPEGIWQVVYSGDKWITSRGGDRYRRGLYTFWRRTSPHPAMTAFDAPSREVCVLQRPRTNTPLQALALLNDPACFEAAQALARRLMTEGGGDVSSRIGYGFRLCLSRHPEVAERDRMAELYQTELAHFREDAEAAKALVGDAVPSKDQRLDTAELAAWTVVANVLLNLDEMVTKD